LRTSLPTQINARFELVKFIENMNTDKPENKLEAGRAKIPVQRFVGWTDKNVGR